MFLSTVLLFCFLFVFGSLLAGFKSGAFVFLLNNGLVKWGDINNSGNEFVNSPYWFPLHFFSAIIAQFFSSYYLVKKSRGVEYTNGLALGLVSAILIYQLEVVSALMGIAVSVFVAHKMKDTKQSDIKNKFP